jgi:hypothetical protein
MAELGEKFGEDVVEKEWSVGPLSIAKVEPNHLLFG